jgi:hypothetical protein
MRWGSMDHLSISADDSSVDVYINRIETLDSIYISADSWSHITTDIHMSGDYTSIDHITISADQSEVYLSVDDVKNIDSLRISADNDSVVTADIEMRWGSMDHLSISADDSSDIYFSVADIHSLDSLRVSADFNSRITVDIQTAGEDTEINYLNIIADHNSTVDVSIDATSFYRTSQDVIEGEISITAYSGSEAWLTLINADYNSLDILALGEDTLVSVDFENSTSTNGIFLHGNDIYSTISLNFSGDSQSLITNVDFTGNLDIDINGGGIQSLDFSGIDAANLHNLDIGISLDTGASLEIENIGNIDTLTVDTFGSESGQIEELELSNARFGELNITEHDGNAFKLQLEFDTGYSSGSPKSDLLNEGVNHGEYPSAISLGYGAGNVYINNIAGGTPGNTAIEFETKFLAESISFVNVDHASIKFDYTNAENNIYSGMMNINGWNETDKLYFGDYELHTNNIFVNESASSFNATDFAGAAADKLSGHAASTPIYIAANAATHDVYLAYNQANADNAGDVRVAVFLDFHFDTSPYSNLNQASLLSLVENTIYHIV